MARLRNIAIEEPSSSPRKEMDMSDDLRKKRPQDSSKINVNEPWEVEYWTSVLGVSASRLKQLVNEHGTSAAVIKSKV